VDHRFEPVAARLDASGCAGRPVITADRNWATGLPLTFILGNRASGSGDAD
jgi:hypothetical protein